MSALTLLLLLIAAVACGGGGTSGQPSSTTTSASTTVPSSTTTMTSSTTTAVACDATGFARDERRADTVPAGAATLRELRTGSQDCYERVTFEFAAGNAPMYAIGPANPPFAGPSGDPVTLRGSSFIEVRFDTTNAHSPDGLTSYIARSTIPANMRALQEIRLIEDFEAVVRLVIGLDSPRPFRVGTLSDPPRVYVDVARS
jgi:hypothetical protein